MKWNEFFTKRFGIDLNGEVDTNEQEQNTNTQTATNENEGINKDDPNSNNSVSADIHSNTDNNNADIMVLRKEIEELKKANAQLAAGKDISGNKAQDITEILHTLYGGVNNAK